MGAVDQDTWSSRTTGGSPSCSLLYDNKQRWIEGPWASLTINDAKRLSA